MLTLDHLSRGAGTSTLPHYIVEQSLLHPSPPPTVETVQLNWDIHPIACEEKGRCSGPDPFPEGATKMGGEETGLKRNGLGLPSSGQFGPAVNQLWKP